MKSPAGTDRSWRGGRPTCTVLFRDIVTRISVPCERCPLPSSLLPLHFLSFPWAHQLFPWVPCEHYTQQTPTGILLVLWLPVFALASANESSCVSVAIFFGVQLWAIWSNWNHAHISTPPKWRAEHKYHEKHSAEISKRDANSGVNNNYVWRRSPSWLEKMILKKGKWVIFKVGEALEPTRAVKFCKGKMIN